MNVIIGYARVSTADQNLDRQIDQLTAKGCKIIYQEKMTGTRLSRPEFKHMMMALRPGDTLIVESFSRLSRSTEDLLRIVHEIELKEVNLISLKENVDTTTAMGKLIFTLCSALSQFERDLLSERTQEGLASARLRGRSGGRPKKYGEDIKKAALALYEANTLSNKAICDKLHIKSLSTLNRWIAEAKKAEA